MIIPIMIVHSAMQLLLIFIMVVVSGQSRSEWRAAVAGEKVDVIRAGLGILMSSLGI